MALVFPTNPIDGQLFDRYIYNDAKGVWDIVPDDVFPYYVGPTKPTSPKEGMGWFNTENAQTYIYYDDGVAGNIDRTNLIANPSFETDISGWTYYAEASFSRDLAHFYSGVASAYLQDDGSFHAALYYDGSSGFGVPVTPGLPYTASAYVLQKTITSTSYITMSWYNSSGANIGAITTGNSFATNTSTWSRGHVTQIAPAGAAYLTIGVWVNDQGYLNGTYVDAVMIEQSDKLHDYVEGTVTITGTSGQWVATSGAVVVPNSNSLALLEDVALTSPADNDVVSYDTATSSWVNRNLNDDFVRLNPKTISETLNIPSGYNGTSAGPLTIADGVTVTIADGSSWSVV